MELPSEPPVCACPYPLCSLTLSPANDFLILVLCILTEFPKVKAAKILL